MYVYTGNDDSPEFLYAVSSTGRGWDAGASSSTTGCLPAALEGQGRTSPHALNVSFSPEAHADNFWCVHAARPGQPLLPNTGRTPHPMLLRAHHARTTPPGPGCHPPPHSPPPVVTLATLWVAIRYTGARRGTPAALLAAMATPANWVQSNAPLTAQALQRSTAAFHVLPGPTTRAASHPTRGAAALATTPPRAPAGGVARAPVAGNGTAAGRSNATAGPRLEPGSNETFAAATPSGAAPPTGASPTAASTAATAADSDSDNAATVGGIVAGACVGALLLGVGGVAVFMHTRRLTFADASFPAADAGAAAAAATEAGAGAEAGLEDQQVYKEGNETFGFGT